MQAPENGDARADATSEVVAEVNAVHGLGLSLRGPTRGGFQSGAWMLERPDGRPAILKWREDGNVEEVERIAAAVDRLRAHGYPTPAWLAAGVTGTGRAYHVQELASGVPSTPLTPATTPLLIEVLELHAGLDPEPRRDRSAAVATAAVDESPGSYRHTVRTLGARGKALLAAYDSLLDRHPGTELPGGDLVHGDFNTCNILLHEGRVSAVIDIEELGSGSRVIDYACLLRESYASGYDDEVARRIRQVAEPIAGLGALAICTAATAFFIVGFKMRHQPEQLDSTLSGLHRLAEDLARPLH